MVVVDSILFLNEKATFLIDAMKYKSAANLLHEGISRLEKEHGFGHNDEHQANNSDLHMKVMDCDGQPAVVVEPSITLPSMQGTNGEHKDSYSIYRRAMKLVPTDSSQDMDSKDLVGRHINLVSSVLLYNYGLCLHVQGISTGCENNLEDAIVAYEMALGLLGLAEQGQSLLLFELALLNNVGHIHDFFLSTGHVHECLRRMHFVMLSATNGWTTRIPSELSTFAHNVLFNASQHIRPAPVA